MSDRDRRLQPGPARAGRHAAARSTTRRPRRFVASSSARPMCSTARRPSAWPALRRRCCGPSASGSATRDGARASGVVSEAQYFGAFTRVRWTCGRHHARRSTCRSPSRLPAPGQTVHLHWDARCSACARGSRHRRGMTMRSRSAAPAAEQVAPPRRLSDLLYTRRGLLLAAAARPAAAVVRRDLPRLAVRAARQRASSASTTSAAGWCASSR